MSEDSRNLLSGGHKTVGISLPGRLMDAARQRAQAEERPFSWIVRRALVDYLQGPKAKPGEGSG